jgi:hypothetical protein
VVNDIGGPDRGFDQGAISLLADVCIMASQALSFSECLLEQVE